MINPSCQINLEKRRLSLSVHPHAKEKAMMKSIVRSALFVATGALSVGCQLDRPCDLDTVYLEAAQVPKRPAAVIKEVHVPVPSPQLRRLSTIQTSGLAETPTAEETIAAANAEATQGPDPNRFIEAVQVYDYVPGVVYEVFASPGHITTIQLRPGEKLIAKLAGDTAQWVVGDSRTGSGASARTLILIKPVKPHVETNLVISTNERVYSIDLKSVPEAYHSAVAWNYPTELAHQLVEQYEQAAREDEQAIDHGVTLSSLDFGYTLTSNTHVPPRWMPKRVFNDGRKTYIHFPKDLAVTDAPPLFVLGSNPKDQEAQLVNYRVKGNYYIVDQLIDRAQLRLGKTPQQIVTIQRGGR